MNGLTRKNILDILATQKEGVSISQLVSAISVVWNISEKDVKAVLLPLVASGEIERVDDGTLRVKTDDC